MKPRSGGASCMSGPAAHVTLTTVPRVPLRWNVVAREREIAATCGSGTSAPNGAVR